MIKEIRIKNFAGIKETNLNLEKKTVLFLGKNGQGKTSIKNALVWAITGSLPGLLKKEEPKLINNGSSFLEVELQIGDKKVSRKRTKTTVKGDPIFPNEIGQLIWSSPWKVFNWFTSKEGKSWLGEKIQQKQKNNLKKLGLSLPANIEEIFIKKGIKEAHETVINLRRQAKRRLDELEKITLSFSEEDYNPQKEKELEKELDSLLQYQFLIQKAEGLRQELKQKEELKEKLDKIEKSLSNDKLVFSCPILKKACPVPGVTRIPALSNSSKNFEGVNSALLYEEKQKTLALLDFLQKKEEELKELEKRIESVSLSKREIEDRIKKINEEIGKIQLYKKQHAQFSQIQAQKKKLQENIELYNDLAKKLDPANGKDFADNHLLEKINDCLAKWVQFMGFQIKLNKDFELEVADGRPIIGLSFSEVYRAGLALSIVLAELCKIKILLIDDAEVLVQDTQIKFVKWLKALEAEGYQILVFAAAKEEPKPNPAFQIVKVEEGKTIIL